MKNPFTNAKVFKVGADPDTYHQDNGAVVGHPARIMSNSQVKLIASCPSKWRSGVEDEQDTASTLWGTLIDSLVMPIEESARLMIIRPATYPDSKTGEAKPWSGNSNWCKQWLADHQDKLVVKQEDFDLAKSAVERLHADAKIHDLIACSTSQTWLRGEYQDKETGIVVPVKALVDMVPDGKHEKFGKCLADLKTCRSASPRPFSRQIFQCGYHIQAAWYLDLWNAATGEDRNEWRFVLSENTPPYQPGRRLLSEEYLSLGRQQYKAALALYCQCLATNTWPSYDDGDGTMDGWTISEPEPWMIIAQTDYSYEPDWMSGDKKQPAEASV